MHFRTKGSSMTRDDIAWELLVAGGVVILFVLLGISFAVALS